MIKYKVVKYINNKYLSAIVKGEGQVRYIINEWVTASEYFNKNRYFLCVFNNLGNALDFLRLRGNVNTYYKIFECKVKGRNRIPKCTGYFDFPAGTEMWEYVKLLKEVKKDG